MKTIKFPLISKLKSCSLIHRREVHYLLLKQFEIIMSFHCQTDSFVYNTQDKLPTFICFHFIHSSRNIILSYRNPRVLLHYYGQRGTAEIREITTSDCNNYYRTMINIFNDINALETYFRYYF